MSRTFWVVVGAVGGVTAYRKGTRVAARAKELGPMGSAQVAATATSKIAGRTAAGLGRLQDRKAHRDGRMVTGSIEAGGVDAGSVEPPPVGWLRAPAPARPIPDAGGPRAGAQSSAHAASEPGKGGR